MDCNSGVANFIIGGARIHIFVFFLKSIVFMVFEYEYINMPPPSIIEFTALLDCIIIFKEVNQKDFSSTYDVDRNYIV